jgi:hypothetical protein
MLNHFLLSGLGRDRNVHDSALPVRLPRLPNPDKAPDREATEGPRMRIRDQAEGTEAAMRLFTYPMKQTLLEHQLLLLREVVGLRCPDLSQRVMSADITGLTRGERERIVVALGSEFASSGTGSDWEPTERGLQLEGLLDIVNRPVLDGAAPT